MKNTLHNTIYLGWKDLIGEIYLSSDLLVIFSFRLKPVDIKFDLAQGTQRSFARRFCGMELL